MMAKPDNSGLVRAMTLEEKYFKGLEIQISRNHF